MNQHPQDLTEGANRPQSKTQGGEPTFHPPTLELPDGHYSAQLVPAPKTQAVTFHVGPDHVEILRLDKQGMTYMGARIEDAGEAHKAFLDAMSRMNRPTPFSPPVSEATKGGEAPKHADPTSLLTSSESLHEALAVFFKDWKDGDFELPRLAQIHAENIRAKYLDVGKALLFVEESYQKLQREVIQPAIALHASSATKQTVGGGAEALALARAALERTLEGAPSYDGYYAPHRKAVAAIKALGIEAAILETPEGL